MPDEDVVAALVDDAWVVAHRLRALDPDRPVLRGSAQNPDVFFQAREAANPYMLAVPGIVEGAFARLGEATGRRYGLVDYHGAPDAERVVVLMGSGAGAATEAVDALVASGERVGLLQVRLYRPFPVAAFIGRAPADGAQRRSTRSHQGAGCARRTPLSRRRRDARRVGSPSTGDRWSVRSRVEGVHARDGQGGARRVPPPEPPRHGFTVGIVDDVTHTSLAYDREFRTDHARVRAMFYGLGADGTVGANKHTAKIVGSQTALQAQAYFVYDSKKSGSTTVSHVRFDDKPIRSTYLIEHANFIACHQFGLLDRIDVLACAEPGATFLLNSPYPVEANVGPAATRGPGADHLARPRCPRDRRPSSRPRGRTRRTDQHGHASVLLRADRCDASGGRRSPRCGSRLRWRTAGWVYRSWRRMSPRSTTRWQACDGSWRRTRSPRPSVDDPRSTRARRTSCNASPHACSRAVAICCR